MEERQPRNPFFVPLPCLSLVVFSSFNAVTSFSVWKAAAGMEGVTYLVFIPFKRDGSSEPRGPLSVMTRPQNSSKTLCQTFSARFLRRKVLFTSRQNVCRLSRRGELANRKRRGGGEEEDRGNSEEGME